MVAKFRKKIKGGSNGAALFCCAGVVRGAHAP